MTQKDTIGNTSCALKRLPENDPAADQEEMVIAQKAVPLPTHLAMIQQCTYSRNFYIYIIVFYISLIK